MDLHTLCCGGGGSEGGGGGKHTCKRGQEGVKRSRVEQSKDEGEGRREGGGGVRREELPAESLKGGCEVIGPTKVKDLVVEFGNVVASLREIEDL